MDQEKFDQHLMDYLFDELDEVTAAAMKRKIESDAACRKLEAGFRATLEVAQLPAEEPSDDLEERILVAARLAEKGEPWHRKLLRSLAWAGSHAMRPQLAMAAILVLVLGSSILLLRARPGSVAVTPSKDEPASVGNLPGDGQAEPKAVPTTLAEAEGAAPSADEGSAADPSDAASQDAASVAELDEIYDRGLSNHRAGNHTLAQRDFAIVAASKSARAPSAAFYEAEATRALSGCSAAASKYQTVISRYPGTAVASDASWKLADCYWQLGQQERARALWRSLLESKDYGERAARELKVRGEAASTGGSAVASKRRAAAAQEAAPPPEEQAPAAPAAESAPPAAPPPAAKAAPPDEAVEQSY